MILQWASVPSLFYSSSVLEKTSWVSFLYQHLLPDQKDSDLGSRFYYHGSCQT